MVGAPQEDFRILHNHMRMNRDQQPVDRYIAGSSNGLQITVFAPVRSKKLMDRNARRETRLSPLLSIRLCKDWPIMNETAVAA